LGSGRSPSPPRGSASIGRWRGAAGSHALPRPLHAAAASRCWSRSAELGHAGLTRFKASLLQQHVFAACRDSARTEPHAIAYRAGRMHWASLSKRASHVRAGGLQAAALLRSGARFCARIWCLFAAARPR
jgi:hypothetical protein